LVSLHNPLIGRCGGHHDAAGDLRIEHLEGEAPEDPSGADAPMLAGEFGFSEAEVAESECKMLANGVQLCEEPGGVAVGGEELDDGFEVDGGALGAAVLEEFRVNCD
jgi:hypothetical protein